MRNMIQYPVTKDEILFYINERKMEALERAKTGVCGDLTPAILSKLEEIVSSLSDEDIMYNGNIN